MKNSCTALAWFIENSGGNAGGDGRLRLLVISSSPESTDSMSHTTWRTVEIATFSLFTIFRGLYFPLWNECLSINGMGGEEDASKFKNVRNCLLNGQRRRTRKRSDSDHEWFGNRAGGALPIWQKIAMTWVSDHSSPLVIVFQNERELWTDHWPMECYTDVYL